MHTFVLLIPVGQYYTGVFDFLVFVNDPTIDGAAHSAYRHINLYDASLTLALATDTGASASDGLTANPTLAGHWHETDAATSLQARIGSSGSFTDITDIVQADGSFTLDRERLSDLNGGRLPYGDYAIEVRAQNISGTTNSDEVAKFAELNRKLFTVLDYTSALQPYIDDTSLKAALSIVGGAYINRYFIEGSFNDDSFYANILNASNDNRLQIIADKLSRDIEGEVEKRMPVASNALVYLGICDGLTGEALSNAFQNNDAGAVSGYTGIGGTEFADQHGLAAFNQLTTGTATGEIIGLGNVYPNDSRVRFELHGSENLVV